MRHCICLAALVCASAARAATIVSPGPPDVPADWLEINLDWLPSDPGYLNARPIYSPGDKQTVVDQHFWTPRTGEQGSASRFGWVELHFAPTLGADVSALLLKLAPELAADLDVIDVEIGERVGDLRPVTITATGGYSRTYDSVQIPEPSAWLLAVVACCLVRRGRHVTASL